MFSPSKSSEHTKREVLLNRNLRAFASELRTVSFRLGGLLTAESVFWLLFLNITSLADTFLHKASRGLAHSFAPIPKVA